MKVCMFIRVVTAVISLDRQQVMHRYQFLVHLKNNHHLREHPQQAFEIKNEKPSSRMMKKKMMSIKREETNLP